MVSVTCYGGVEEIGGNKILVEDQDTSIWLDFGMSFTQYGTFFEEYMSPRTSPGVRDYLMMNLIPDIQGLYAPDVLQMADREPEEPDFDAVFISHPHDDHIKYLSFLHPDITVYMGETCYAIREALQEMESGTIENRIISYKRRQPSGSTANDVIDRSIETFRTGDTITIGSIDVEPVHVDHSIPGAYGFIIHATDATLVYTGDLRNHGRNAAMTQDFVEQARAADPDILLSEGTRITDTDQEGESEAQVQTTMKNHGAATDGLIVADYSFKDVDRFRTVFQVAQALNRTLVIDTKPAYLYQTYAEDPGLDTPSIDHENILIHRRQKRSWRKWERPLRDREDTITSKEIGEHPDQYILALNQWKLNELVDVNPEHALYIRSHSEPWDEETQLDEERVNNWVNHFNMNKVWAHCSGHAPGQELRDIITNINAETILPIHTEHPEAFTSLGETCRVTYGDSLTL